MELATHPNSRKKTKKTASSKESQFRHALDTCSKSRDLSGALALYHSAVSGEEPTPAHTVPGSMLPPMVAAP